MFALTPQFYPILSGVSRYIEPSLDNLPDFGILKQLHFNSKSFQKLENSKLFEK